MNKWKPKLKIQYHWVLIAQVKIKYLGLIEQNISGSV